jgi:hypothetical protein
MPDDKKDGPKATAPTPKSPEKLPQALEGNVQAAETDKSDAPNSGSTTPSVSSTASTQWWGIAWIVGIYRGVRDDFAKDAMKAGIKYLWNGIVWLILGGGTYWIASSIVGYKDIGNSKDGPGYNYLRPIIAEAERELGGGVSWTNPAAKTSSFLYCEPFLTQQSDPVERLEQFVEQFSGCLSISARAVGQETFYHLELGPEATKPICLANADGELVEALTFCRCDADTMAEAAETHAFLTETGATNVAPCR